MGFLWSKLETPLNQSLIANKSDDIIRSLDIILVPYSDMEIVLDSEIWKMVGIVIYKDTVPWVLLNGQFYEMATFIKNHTQLFIRHCHCIRPMGFKRQVLSAAKRTVEIIQGRDLDEIGMGFCVGSVLGIIGLLDNLPSGKIKPHHFSSESPFNRLQLKDYSKNYLI